MVDLAGGEGRNAIWFASRGWKAENVEFSEVALTKFRSRAESLGFDDATFATLADAKTAKFQLEPDLLLVCYLQLPWEELKQALENGLSQVRNGQIFGVWHALRNVTDGYGGPPRPELNVDPENLNAWAADNNLNATVEERQRRVETPDGPRFAIDVIFSAEVASN